MQLGDILVAKGLVSTEDVHRAIEHQRANGGRLGDCFVALNIVTKEQIEDVLSEAPVMPRNLDDTGVDPMILLELVIKGMQAENLEKPSQMAESTKLPTALVNALLKDAVDRKLIEALGQADAGTGALSELRYGLTRAGRDYALEALDQCSYFGPAPVSLDAYKDRIMRQRITNEWVSRPMLDE
jgi:hypothetical protein